MAKKGSWALTGLWRNTIALVIGCGCLLFSGSNLADDAPLTSGQGYMLIRLNLNKGERVATLAMTNVDTNQIIRCRAKFF